MSTDERIPLDRRPFPISFPSTPSLTVHHGPAATTAGGILSSTARKIPHFGSATLFFAMPSQLPPLCLAYHGVSATPVRSDPSGLFTSSAQLTRHIKALRRWGYRFTRFREFADAAAEHRAGNLCSLTFDDGLADLLDGLLPVLETTGATATVFAVSTWLAVQHPDAPWAVTLDADGLRALAARGVEIGCHSAEHRDMATMSYEDALADFTRSKRELEELVGLPVRTAAYPFGRTSADAQRACRDAGFEAACVISGQGSWDDRWALPRQDMDATATIAGLRLKRANRYEAVVGHPAGRAVRAAVKRLRRLTNR